MQAGDRLGGCSDVLCEPLAELLGNAKVSPIATELLPRTWRRTPQPLSRMPSAAAVVPHPPFPQPAPRESATAAALALMAAAGPQRVLEGMLTPATAGHKNWRVREGLLALYAAHVARFAGGAAVLLDAVLPRAADALNDAQPTVRQAGVEALAALAVQTGLQRVMAALSKRDVRPAHVASVQARYRELAAGGGGGGDGAAPAPPAPQQQQQPAARPPQPASSSGPGRPAPLQQRPSQQPASYAASQPSNGGPTPLARTRPAPEPPSPSAAAPATVAPARGGRLDDGGSRTDYSGSSSNSSSAAPAAGRQPYALPRGGGAAAATSGSLSSTTGSVGSSSFGGGGGTDGVLIFEVQQLHPADVASDADVQALCGLADHPSLWHPGVLGSLIDDAGKVKPVACASLRDAAKVVDDVAALCATSNSDWKARQAALERLRGAIVGGAASLEGFATLLPRLRDPLVTQVQDLRSSVVRSACVAVAELAAATALTSAFEPLADVLIETLLRQTSVTIAVVASSAASAAASIVHNSRYGFHRVLPRLITVLKHKHSQQRTNAATCLLAALRLWPSACIERHADEVQATVGALLHDADASVRALGRLAFWSFASHFPERGDALAERLDEAKLRQLDADQGAAFEALVAALCEPVAVLVGGGVHPDGVVAPAPAAAVPAYTGAMKQQQQQPMPRAQAPPASAPAVRFDSSATGGGGGGGHSVTWALNTSTGSTASGGGSVGSKQAQPSQQQPQQPAKVRAASAGATVSAPQQQTWQPQLAAPAAPAAVPRAASAGIRQPPPSAASSYVAAASLAPAQWSAVAPQQAGGGTPARPASDQLPQQPPLSQPLANSPVSSAIAAAVSRALTAATSAGASDVHLRGRLSELMQALAAQHAVSSPSVERGYGGAAAVPPALAAALPPFDPEYEYVPEPGVDEPVLLDNLAGPAAAAVAAQLAPAAPAAPGTLTSLLERCLSHPSPGVRADAAALWYALLDTGADLQAAVLTAAGDALPPHVLAALQDAVDGTDPAVAAATRHVAAAPDVTATRTTRARVPIVNDAGEDDFADIDVLPVYGHAFAAAAPGGGGDDASALRRTLPAVLALTLPASQPALREAGQRCLTLLKRSLRPDAVAAAALAAVGARDAPPAVRRQALSLLCALAEGDTPQHDDGSGEAPAQPHEDEDVLTLLGPPPAGGSGHADGLLALLSGAAECLSGPDEAAADGDAGGASSSSIDGAAGALDALCDMVDAVYGTDWLAEALERLPVRSAHALRAVADPDGPLAGALQQLLGGGGAAAPAPTRSAPAAEPAPAPYQRGPPGSAQQPPYHQQQQQQQPARPLPQQSPLSLAELASLSPHAAAQGPVAGAAAASARAPAQHHTYARTAAAAAAAAAAAQPQPPPALAAPAPVAAPAPSPQPLPALPLLPFTRETLAMITDAFSSPDRSRRIQGLHFLGRNVDVPASHGPDGRPRPPPRPTTVAEVTIPRAHRDDGGWCAAWERVLDGVLSFVPLQLDPATGGPDGVLSQTALSVLRKLYRNYVHYAAHKAGAVLAGLHGAMGPGVPRDLQAVLEKTAEEVGDRLLLGDQLVLLAVALHDAPADNVPAVSAAARGIGRLLPGAPPSLLLEELGGGGSTGGGVGATGGGGGGWLLAGIRRAVNAAQPLTRKAGMTLLLGLALALGDATLAPYAAAVLSPPQLRLLWTQAAAARAGGGAGGDGGDPAAALSPLAVQLANAF